MAIERFDDIMTLLKKLQEARPSNHPAQPWECLECARVCDLTVDDYCPTCGRPLPEEENG